MLTNRGSSWNYLKGQIFRQKKRLLWSAFNGLVAGLSTTALLAMINHDAASAGGYRLVASWPFALLLLLSAASSLVSGVALVRLSQGFLHELRVSFCSQILNTSLRELEKIGIPRLLTVLTEDIATIAQATMMVPALITNGALLVGCSAYLCYLSPPIFMGVAILLLMGVGIYTSIARRAGDHIRVARLLEDDLFTHYRQITQGVKELAMHKSRGTAFIADLLSPTSINLMAKNQNGLIGYAYGQSVSQSLFLVILAAPVFFGSFGSRTGSNIVPQFVATLIFALMPITAIVSIVPIIFRAFIAVKKMDDLQLNRAIGRADGDVNVNPPVCSDIRMSFVNATYRYDVESEGFGLGPLTMEMSSGQAVFIVGGNGSGKTTFSRLICGLYPPSDGGVFLNGISIVADNVPWYSSHIGAVFADYWLFDELPSTTPDSLRRAKKYLEMFDLDGKVSIEQGKFSTVDLSQGQRRRLALISALIEDRPVYVFDEWAADQDPKFKEYFYLELIPELRREGKLIIVISHDDRFFHVADKVYKLESGLVVEQSLNPPNSGALRIASKFDSAYDLSSSSRAV